jgi:hypothetical protein
MKCGFDLMLCDTCQFRRWNYVTVCEGKHLEHFDENLWRACFSLAMELLVMHPK